MSKRLPNLCERRWREARALAAKPGSPGRDAKLRDALDAFVTWSLGSSWQLTSPTTNGDAAPAIVLKHRGRELWTELSSAGAMYSVGLPSDAQARTRLEGRIRTIIETLAGAWLSPGWKVMKSGRPLARERAREQAVLIGGHYHAVMRCLEDYNPTAQRLPSGDEARQPHRKLAVRRVPQFVWVDRALLPGGGDSRLERMADAPWPHGLRRGRLDGPTRRKRKPEPIAEHRARLGAVFHEVWKDAGLSQIDGWQQLERIHPRWQHVILRGAKRLAVIPAPTDELVRKWVDEVTSIVDKKSSLAQHIAYRLVGYRWDLPPDWVKSKIRDAQNTKF